MDLLTTKEEFLTILTTKEVIADPVLDKKAPLQPSIYTGRGYTSTIIHRVLLFEGGVLLFMM